MDEFSKRAMVKRQRLGVQIGLTPVKRVLPDKPERIAKEAIYGRRGLHLRECIQDQRMVGPNQPVVHGMPLAVLPSPPTGAAGPNLQLLACIGRSCIQAIAFAEGMPRDAAPAHDPLLIAAP
ncbi:hypothetical protein GCM10007920_05030 [Ciceribacter naphthalenivorans]|uniref:Uncharacterized protein n=2 Tax=Alphaproteobacteria TaxID=28211 RepID=A0A512HGZ3_9HYPH|nr:hypothetical protein RNA01_15920 [Ciceribacter naphthalenivorans]GLR20719.1 hypothetical protein GCM10007920_05030 [Ciceribacter naphthalenivorans]GLT03575.1 hypothetical protein GCM10007926_05030 [Sphingomonas psychrolutea]